MKRKSDEMSPLGQKDTYRRSEMEFGVAADAYRSDPAKKATRNGAVMVTVAFSIAAFAMVLAASVAICGELTLVGILVSVVVALAMLSSVHVCMDWERAVVMRLGKFNRLAGPGLFFTIPLLEFCTLRVDQRMNVTPFGAEEALTSDLVPLDVDAVLFWVIWDPEKACTEVEDCYFAVALSAQTARCHRPRLAAKCGYAPPSARSRTSRCRREEGFRLGHFHCFGRGARPYHPQGTAGHYVS